MLLEEGCRRRKSSISEPGLRWPSASRACWYTPHVGLSRHSNRFLKRAAHLRVADVNNAPAIRRGLYEPGPAQVMA